MSPKLKNSILALVMVFALIQGVSFAQAEAEEQWVSTATFLAASWFAMYDAGALDMLMAHYADDVIVRHPDGSVTTGVDAQRASLQGFIDNGIAFHPAGGASGWAPLHAGLLGEDGAWGRWGFEAVDGEGNVVAVGETVYIYRAVAGGWQIVSQHNYFTTAAPQN